MERDLSSMVYSREPEASQCHSHKVTQYTDQPTN